MKSQALTSPSLGGASSSTGEGGCFSAHKGPAASQSRSRKAIAPGEGRCEEGGAPPSSQQEGPVTQSGTSGLAATTLQAQQKKKKKSCEEETSLEE